MLGRCLEGKIFGCAWKVLGRSSNVNYLPLKIHCDNKRRYFEKTYLSNTKCFSICLEGAWKVKYLVMLGRCLEGPQM
jgi:hypothetical protein